MPSSDSNAAVSAVMSSALLSLPVTTTSALSVPLFKVTVPIRSDGTESDSFVFTFVSTAAVAASLIPLLILSDNSVAFTVRPSTPTKPANPAVACKLVNFRVASDWSVISASAKSVLSSAKPIRSMLLPFKPAKALISWPPSVRRSACSIASPFDSVTLPVLFANAKSPTTLKNPKRSRVNCPLAFSVAPSLPGILSFRSAAGSELVLILRLVLPAA